MSQKNLIELRDVVKTYGMKEAQVQVLKGASACISQGEKCVLFGPSGSGKSTILNLIGGLESLDSGEILFQDQPITSFNKSQLVDYRRQNLGFIFQFYNLIPDLTIKENIEVGAYISKDPLSVDELLENLGLKDQRNKFPRQVSGGQQQRCDVARALVKNPKLLLCDEPTGALDYKTSKEMLGLLDKINADYGCTMIIVTHNQAIAPLCNHVLSLRDGIFCEDIYNEEVLSAEEISW